VNSRIDDNATGVHGDANSVTVVQGSTATGNTGSGFETAKGGAMTIIGSNSSLNGTGVNAAGIVVINGVTVTKNAENLTIVKGGSILSFHNNPIGDNGAKKQTLPNGTLHLE